MESTKMITIADWLLIAVTFTGPIVAVQVQKWIERIREKRNQKRWIFHTLMATRAIRVGSNEHVQALNLIDLFFDKKNAKDKAVLDAWAIYFDHLRSCPEGREENVVRAWDEKGTELLVELLYATAYALRYDFNKVQLKRGAYFPKLHSDNALANLAIRDNLVNLLSGKQSIPIAVTQLPVAEEAVKRQQELGDALLKTLSGDKPIQISIEQAQPSASMLQARDDRAA